MFRGEICILILLWSQNVTKWWEQNVPKVRRLLSREEEDQTEGALLVMPGELIFFSLPKSALCAGGQVDICVLCVFPPARTCSGSVPSLDLGTGNFSSCPEAQTIASPWPRPPLAQLEHAVQGRAAVSAALGFLCQLLISSRLSPGSRVGHAQSILSGHVFPAVPAPASPGTWCWGCSAALRDNPASLAPRCRWVRGCCRRWCSSGCPCPARAAALESRHHLVSAGPAHTQPGPGLLPKTRRKEKSTQAAPSVPYLLLHNSPKGEEIDVAVTETSSCCPPS